MFGQKLEKWTGHGYSFASSMGINICEVMRKTELEVQVCDHIRVSAIPTGRTGAEITLQCFLIWARIHTFRIVLHTHCFYN